MAGGVGSEHASCQASNLCAYPFAFNEAKGVIGGLSFLGGDDYKTSAELV